MRHLAGLAMRLLMAVALLSTIMPLASSVAQIQSGGTVQEIRIEGTQRVVDVSVKERQESGREPLIVGMDRYAIAAQVSFYGERYTGATLQTSNSVLFDGVGLMYERWTPPAAEAGRDLLLVAWDAGELRDAIVEPRAERVGPIQEETLMRDGVFVRHYYHRMAYNYRSAHGK